MWKLGILRRRFGGEDGYRHQPLSEFKQYGVYFALSILLLDVTFNAMIMAGLSRRHLGEVAT